MNQHAHTHVQHTGIAHLSKNYNVLRLFLITSTPELKSALSDIKNCFELIWIRIHIKMNVHERN